MSEAPEFNPETDIGVPLEILARLRDPWPLDVIRWRVDGKEDRDTHPAMPHVDARDVANRLDDTLGPQNWRDSYVPGPNGIIATLEIRVRLYWPTDPTLGLPATDEGCEWLSKQDAGETPKIGGIKGGVSNALKRVFAKFGGRDLYEVERMYVKAVRRGDKWYPHPSEQAKLRAALMQARGVSDPVTNQNVEERWNAAVAWALRNDLTEKALRDWLEIEPKAEIQPEHVEAVSVQAKAVHQGDLSPEEAFGPDAQQRARAVDEAIGAKPRP